MKSQQIASANLTVQEWGHFLTALNSSHQVENPLLKKSIYPSQLVNRLEKQLARRS
jgi:hypothetical protein